MSIFGDISTSATSAGSKINGSMGAGQTLTGGPTASNASPFATFRPSGLANVTNANLSSSNAPASILGATQSAGVFGSAFGGKPATTTGGVSSAAAQSQPALGLSTTTNQPKMMAQAASTSVFGASTAGMGEQTQGTSQPMGAYFDSLLTKSKKHSEGDNALGSLPSLQLGLGDLRQKLKDLGPRLRGRALDGKAHYLLAASGVDPGAAVRDLGVFGSLGRTDRPQEGGVGELDVETYLSNIQTKTTLSMISDGLERSVRDFDNFLEDHVTMEWDAQRTRVYQHFGIKPREESKRPATAAAARDSQACFGRSRRKGSSTAGLRSSQRASTFGSSSMHRSILGTPTRVGSHKPEFTDIEGMKDAGGPGSVEDRSLKDKQGKLAGRIHALNDARQAKEPFFLCSELAELLDKSGDRHGPEIADAYRAVMELVGEDAERNKAPPSRSFAKSYLGSPTGSSTSSEMRKEILRGARRYLEKQFWKEFNMLISKHPQEASLGGRPDVLSKIKAYIRLRVARKSLVPDGLVPQHAEGDYIWATVFYLLRAGFVSEAAQYVNDMSHIIRSIDRNFPGYINSYAASEDRRLKRPMQEKMVNEFHLRLKTAPEGTIDPFRMAVWKIIGRCDITNRSLDNLQTDVNDWTWLQFNLAQEAERSTELATHTFGLAELQTSIREIGLRHFPKNPSEENSGNFALFFLLQILSGMYEQAIAYLYPFSNVDAVHFAIALTYHGLLRPAFTALENELLTYSTRNSPQISFGRMLGYYTRDFRAADVAAAVDYLILICLNADEAGDKNQASLCYEALRELVLETREFSKLLGDIQPDGHRIKGTIQERGSLITLGQQDEFVNAITLQAAQFAEDNGRTSDAVLLYHLAGDYDTVVTIISRALSEAISLESGDEPMRLLPVKPRVSGIEAQAEPGSSLSLAAIDDPVELAQTMMAMYERDWMFHKKIRDHNRIACKILLRMSDIKSLVEAGRWTEAYDMIKSLEILPLEAGGDPTVIRAFASRFAGLPQSVAVNVPSLLMWTVTCCTRQRERHLSSQFTGNLSTLRQIVDQLKQASVDLTTYTSQLRYRFPPHLHEALAKASAD